MADTITYTVTTTAGSRKHVIEGSAENDDAIGSLVEAYDGARPGFTLLNPITLYALENVISVSIEGGPPEMMREVQRRLGFTTDNDK